MKQLIFRNLQGHSYKKKHFRKEQTLLLEGTLVLAGTQKKDTTTRRRTFLQEGGFFTLWGKILRKEASKKVIKPAGHPLICLRGTEKEPTKGAPKQDSQPLPKLSLSRSFAQNSLPVF